MDVASKCVIFRSLIIQGEYILVIVSLIQVASKGCMDPDDRLLQRALKKKLPLFIIPCGDEYEFNKLRDKAIDLK